MTRKIDYWLKCSPLQALAHCWPLRQNRQTWLQDSSVEVGIGGSEPRAGAERVRWRERASRRPTERLQAFGEPSRSALGLGARSAGCGRPIGRPRGELLLMAGYRASPRGRPCDYYIYIDGCSSQGDPLPLLTKLISAALATPTTCQIGATTRENGGVRIDFRRHLNKKLRETN